MTRCPKWIAVLGCGLLLKAIVSAASPDLVVVVSAETPVESLTRTELADIYLGRMNRLPNGSPVVPIDQAEDSPEYREFYGEYLSRSPAQIKAHWSKLIFTGRGLPPRTASDGTAVARIVAETPNAIGYVEAGLVDDRLQIVPIE